VFPQFTAEERARLLTSKEWDQLDDTTNLLEPIEQLTRDLSGVKYTTVSAVLPEYLFTIESIESVVCKVRGVHVVWGGRVVCDDHIMCVFVVGRLTSDARFSSVLRCS